MEAQVSAKQPAPGYSTRSSLLPLVLTQVCYKAGKQTLLNNVDLVFGAGLIE